MSIWTYILIQIFSYVQTISYLLVYESICVNDVNFFKYIHSIEHDFYILSNIILSTGLKRLIEVYGTIDDFNMVLSDLQMPVMDGYQCAQRYREFEKEQLLLNEYNTTQVLRHSMPIIDMSANSDSESKWCALLNMNMSLPKPFYFTRNDLQQIVNYFFGFLLYTIVKDKIRYTYILPEFLAWKEYVKIIFSK
jgi:CheY-like chemotaxis protein